MFISKMNRMFHKHGRIAFGILTLVIIVPFVLYFSAAPSELLEMFDFRAKDSLVKINGKTISEDVLQNSITDTLISMAVNGRNVNFDAMSNQKDIIEQAAQRIILLKIAEERGLYVDDLSIAGYIKQLMIFQLKGNFNVNMYKMFVNYYLGRYGITEKQLEQTVREDLLINILQNQISSSVIAVPEEVHQYYNDLNKTFNIQIARFNSSDFIKDVNVKPDELEKFYNKNKDKYLIPAKYKFHAVRFNFIKYSKEAEENVTDKEINAVFDSSKDTLYKGKTEEEAKKEIRKVLINDLTDKLAKNDAQMFAVSAYKQIEHKDDASNIQSYTIFDKFAEKSKFTVQEVDEWVTAGADVVPRLGRVPEVTSILGRLYNDQPVSNAILGKNAYFVICLSDKIEPRKATFEEVKDKVTEEYKTHEASTLAREAAEKAYYDIQAALKTKKSVDNTGIKFENIPDFSQKDYMPLLKVEDGIQIYQAVTETEKGDVSKPVDTQNGAAIVYIKNIILPTDKDYEAVKDKMLEEYMIFKKWLLWYNYINMLKTNANIVIADK